MSTTDDVRQMQSQGLSEQQIRDGLKQRGISDNEISQSMTQAQIKDAVSSSEGAQQQQAGQDEYQPSLGPQIPSPSGGAEYVPGSPPDAGGAQEYGGEYGGYGGQTDYAGYGQPGAGYGQGGGYDSYGGYGGGGYGAEGYQNYQGAMSSDVMTEIAEQVVSEKLANLQDRLEQSIDFRTTAEARIASLSERLRRIEQILDRLQLSLLQKMGEYVGDVKDIKTEMQETQKSFKAIHQRKGKKHP